MGTLRNPYHSATTTSEDAPRRKHYRLGDSMALVADIGQGLNPAFANCDLLYIETAWTAGYEEYSARTVGAVSSWKEYMAAISDAVTSRPSVVVCGRRELRLLPHPKSTRPVNLNTGGRYVAAAVAVSYGGNLPRVTSRHPGWIDIATEDLIHALGRQYQRVGDPCCGYGNTGRIFAEHGKSWVLGDVNPRCIGYITEHAVNWGRS